jgi:hypothetical protein
MASLLITVEKECADALSAAPYFGAIPVLVDPQKNVVQMVQAALAKTGLAVVPLCNRAVTENPGSQGPVFNPIYLEVGVFQNPPMALSFPPPREVAEEICKMAPQGLHLFQPASVPSKLSCLGLEEMPNKILNIYRCRFQFKGGVNNNPANMPQVATPAWDAGAQTFSCATAGAAVFWTAAAAGPGAQPPPMPSPRIGTLALGAVAIPAGMSVKARGWLAGYLASDLLTFST